ncbi:PqqD family peptide modification chaperone [Amycolatopsis anabasis]|uniref:PqqD family peptide modification chaperone n=1 Tax=Amycolatopsis anabasis TaxID=1840409 RepID=UPI00131B1CB9|nr:PqqD family peptide modification chaperone [Amycolatopsis anabasis]
MRLIRRDRKRPASLVLARGVRVTPVDDGHTVLDPRGRVLHLNLSAAVMLDALLAGGTDTAVAAVRARFGVPEDVARADVVRLLGQLVEYKLVRWRR